MAKKTSCRMTTCKKRKKKDAHKHIPISTNMVGVLVTGPWWVASSVIFTNNHNYRSVKFTQKVMGHYCKANYLKLWNKALFCSYLLHQPEPRANARTWNCCPSRNPSLGWGFILLQMRHTFICVSTGKNICTLSSKQTVDEMKIWTNQQMSMHVAQKTWCYN
jgi:hypothetical protein